MKNFLFAISLLCVVSCSVQKRKYQKGFYVSTNKHKTELAKKVSATSKKEIESDNLTIKTRYIETFEAKTINLSTSVENKPITILNSNSVGKRLTGDSLCDQITFRNGDEAKVKVLEITTTEIKYKKCNMPDGPLYIVKKSDVFMIKYPNGTKEVFKSEPVYNSVPNQQQENPQKTYKGPKKTNPYAIASFILGILGIWPLTGLGSVLAIIFGGLAISQIKGNPERYEGESLAKAGRVLGIIVLSIITLIILIVILVALGI
jgi:hypothetical protein